MPAPEGAFQFQRALLWRAVGYGADGQPTRASTSEEVAVRWDSQQARVLDPQGNTITVDATATVGEDIAIGSIMWLGSQQDLEDTLTGTGTGSDEVPDSDIFEVVALSKTPDLKNRFTQRTVGLKRYKDEFMPDA